MMTRLQTKRANLLAQSYETVANPDSELKKLMAKCDISPKIVQIECMLEIYKIQNAHLEYFIKINDACKSRKRLYIVTYDKSVQQVRLITKYMNANTLTKKQTKLVLETIKELKIYQNKYESLVYGPVLDCPEVSVEYMRSIMNQNK